MGALSRELLGPGLMGLMLSGMLLGNMPSMGVYAVSVAGLATRNIYEPLVKGKSEQHYFRAGQWAIGGVLIDRGDLCDVHDRTSFRRTPMLVTFNTFFGAAIFLIIFWRRLTSASIMVGLVDLDHHDGDRSLGTAGSGRISADAGAAAADAAIHRI